MQFVVLVFLSFLTIQAVAKPGLTLEEVIRLARVNAPEIKIASSQASASQYEAQAYLSQAFPTLDFEYQAQRSVSSPTIFETGGAQVDEFRATDYNWALRFATPVYTFGRVGALYTMYKARSEGVQYKAGAAKAQALRSIIAEYVSALNTLKELHVQKAALERARNNHAFVELEFSGGAIKRTDLIASSARLQEAEASFLSAEAAARDARDQLKVVLGLEASAPMDLNLDQAVDSAFFNKPNPATPQTTDALKDLELAKDYAEADAERVAAEYYPQISAFAQLSGRSQDITAPDNFSAVDGSFADSFDEDSRSYAFGLSFNWNLFSGTGSYATSQQQAALAAIARLRYETAQREDRIKQQSQRVYLDSSQKIYEANLKAVVAARLNYETAQSEFKNGARSLTELFEDEEALIQREQKAIRSYGDLILATVDYRINNGWEIAP